MEQPLSTVSVPTAKSPPGVQAPLTNVTPAVGDTQDCSTVLMPTALALPVMHGEVVKLVPATGAAQLDCAVF
jgi:hypothetical protein